MHRTARKDNVTTECIHGLDIARCDLCTPRASAQPPKAKAVRAPATRKAPPISSTKPVTVDAGARRIFHLTHERNLPSILAAGRILADLHGAAPTVDISALDNRELRREVLVGSAPVASFVPFFLAPDALLWDGVRRGETDYRLANVPVVPAQFVLLVSSARAAGDSAVVADGDAADPTTKFSSLSELHGRMPRRLYDEEDALRSAEFLVPEEFPFEAVTLVGVANDKVRSSVRELMQEHGFQQKVSVYPPWFQNPGL